MRDKIDILKDKQIRITPQRVGVLAVLLLDRKHLTAEEIYEKMQKSFPAMSLATVYTTLEVFKEKGIVKELRIKSNKAIYDIITERHHHFYCRNCDKIFDIQMPPCVALRKNEVDGHHIEDLQGYFYGLCSSCQNKEKA